MPSTASDVHDGFQCGEINERSQRSRDNAGPDLRALVRVDQILADLQERMWDAGTLAMMRHGVAVAVARGVRLVVAYRHVALLGEVCHQRLRQAAVAVPQHADMPRPLEALEHR